MKTINVLMSTYNGEKYLQEQIDSILAQQGVKVQLLVRDDGSTDNTLKILQHYKKIDKLKYYQGKNLKSARSFIDLIYNAFEADYYAFADQDDVWLPEKLQQAVKKLDILENINTKPCLYYSGTQLVNKELKPLPTSKKKKYRFSTFTQSLITNQASGCTFVFNYKLLKLTRLYKPVSLSMHDSWLYQLCLAMGGEVVFDERSYILYRQHSNNTVGGKRSIYALYNRRWKNFYYHPCRRSNNIAELVNGYAKYMPPHNLEICNKILNYKSGWIGKWKLLNNPAIRTGDIEIDLFFILSVLLNRF